MGKKKKKVIESKKINIKKTPTQNSAYKRVYVTAKSFCYLFMLLLLVGIVSKMYPYIVILLTGMGMKSLFPDDDKLGPSKCPNISDESFQMYLQEWNQSIFSKKNPETYQRVHIGGEDFVRKHTVEESLKIERAIFSDALEAILNSCDGELSKKFDLISEWKKNHESLDSDVIDGLYEENIATFFEEEEKFYKTEDKRFQKRTSEEKIRIREAYDVLRSSSYDSPFKLSKSDETFSKIICPEDGGKIRGGRENFFEIGSNHGVFPNPINTAKGQFSIDLKFFDVILQELESFVQNNELPLPMEILFRLSIYMSTHLHSNGNYRIATLWVNELLKDKGYPPIHLSRDVVARIILFFDPLNDQNWEQDLERYWEQIKFSNSRYLFKTRYKYNKIKFDEEVPFMFKIPLLDRVRKALSEFTDAIIEGIENYSGPKCKIR